MHIYPLPVAVGDIVAACFLAAALNESTFWPELAFRADADGVACYRPDGGELPEYERQHVEWFARGIERGVHAARAGGTEDCPRCAEYRARDAADERAAERFNEWDD